MRVSYAQLLSAADGMVEGVEVRVLAQQQLGVQTDIPEDAVDIRLGDSSVFKRWVSCYICCCASERLGWLLSSILHGIVGLLCQGLVSIQQQASNQLNVCQ
jgi:hypothetical protein